MPRAVFNVGACIALAAATPAAAGAATSSAHAHAQIVESGAVKMNMLMAMPSVQGSRDGASFKGAVPSMSMGAGAFMGNDSFTVRRNADESAAVTAPGSFMVMRTDGGDSVMLRTSAGAEFGALSDGVLLGGSLTGGAAASIELGNGLRLASRAAPAASPSQPMLVVVVQYN